MLNLSHYISRGYILPDEGMLLVITIAAYNTSSNTCHLLLFCEGRVNKLILSIMNIFNILCNRQSVDDSTQTRICLYVCLFKHMSTGIKYTSYFEK